MQYTFKDEKHDPLEIILRLYEFLKFDMRGPDLISGRWYGSVQSHLIYAYMWLTKEIYYGGMSNYYELGQEGTQYKFFLSALDILLENHSEPYDDGDLAYLAKCKQGVIDDMSLHELKSRIEDGEKLSSESKKLLKLLSKCAIDVEEILCDDNATYPVFVLNYCLKNPVLFDKHGKRIDVQDVGSLKKFFEAEGLWDQGSYENEIPKYETALSRPDGSAEKLGHDRAEEKMIDFSLQESLGKCPKCAANVFELDDSYVCEKSVGHEKTCDFRSGKIILQQPIDIAQMKKLLTDGKTDILDGFVSSHRNKGFSACLVVSEGQIIFDFEENCSDSIDFSSQESLGKCPRCAARVFEQRDAYVCEKSVEPEKTCDFRSAKMILQQPIDTVQMKKLLADGKSDLLDSFVSNRTREKFSAFLVVKEGKFAFELPPPPTEEKRKIAKKKKALEG